MTHGHNIYAPVLVGGWCLLENVLKQTATWRRWSKEFLDKILEMDQLQFGHKLIPNIYIINKNGRNLAQLQLNYLKWPDIEGIRQRSKRDKG